MTVLAESLMPGKFLVCICQVLMAITIFFSYEENIRANTSRSISTGDSDYQDEEVIILLCVIVTLILQGIEIFSLFLGRPLFFDKVNFVQILIHAIGTITLSWYIYYAWDSSTLWIIWFFTSFIPFAFEVYILGSSNRQFKDK